MRNEVSRSFFIVAQLLTFLLGVQIGSWFGNSFKIELCSERVDAQVLQQGHLSSSSAAAAAGLTNNVLDDSNAEGWHNINVFVGNRTSAYIHGSPKRKISQTNQDLMVLDLLNHKTNGYFVDLAANQPIKISNSFRLEYYYNWTGLCIEPNPQYWYGLASLRKCHVVGAVGGKTRGEEITFRFNPLSSYKGTLGGIVGGEFDNKRKNRDETTIEEKRFTVPLVDVLTRFHAPKVIDYLSLDVEGAEDLIFLDFPLDKYSFRLINVERPSGKLREKLKNEGYTLHSTNNFGDTMWINKLLVNVSTTTTAS